MSEDEKCYRAVVWGPEPDSVGQRVTIHAKNLADAKRQLVAQFGEDRIYTLSNDEDASRPR